LTFQTASEASNNNGERGVSNLNRGNYYAATWIRPIAEAAAGKLKNILGKDSGQNINLVGHSLGSILSAEIGAEYKKGNGSTINSIIALDPASETNLNVPGKGNLGGYDVDGRTSAYIPGTKSWLNPFGNPQTCENNSELCQNIDAPQNFRDVAKFSIAFVGSKSLAGNQLLAASAHESYQMNFGDVADVGGEHPRVVEALTQLIKTDGLIDDVSKEKRTDKKYFTIDNLTGRISMNVDKNQYDSMHEGIIDINSANQAERLNYYQDLQKIITGKPPKPKYIPGSDTIYNPFEVMAVSAENLFKLFLNATGKVDVEAQNLVTQHQNKLILNGINGITQSNVSHIGSASTDFFRNPIQSKVIEQKNITAGAKPPSIQEKSQYTNGQIIRTPFDITLTWNQNTPNPLDLDSHLATPNGEHVYFARPGDLNLAPNAFLYRDSIPAAGRGRLGAEQTRITQF
jgi:hypothetical protein